MKNVFQSLLLVIAGASQKELARQLKYLKVENQILRSRLPARITVTAKERTRLVKFAQKVGKAIHELATIVSPGTILRWIREEKKNPKKKPVKRGRPKMPQQIRALILLLARENEWGYTRILGELRKLNIRSISRNTVKAILKENGLDPGPQRGEGTWDEFLKQHAASLWQCDFFSKKVLTIKGIREIFVIAFLNVETRKVVLSPATFHPNEPWVVAQAESFVKQAREQKLPVAMLQRDNDAKIFEVVRAHELKRLRVTTKLTAIRSPNTNAFVERFIQTIQQECLDRFVIFGEQHMDVVCKEFLAHYHGDRPHQSLENDPITKPKKRGRPKTKRGKIEDEIVPLREVKCKERMGGLLKSYGRKAA